MKPFVELSFMPTCLASQKNQIFPYGGNNSMPKSDKVWEKLITKFIEHILERYGKDEVESWYFEVWNEPNLPLDFISTHHYSTDDPLWKSGMDIEEFFRRSKGKPSDYYRGVLKEMTTKTRKEAKEYPLFYTEWNVSAMLGDAIHDEPYAAAMVAKTLADNYGLVDCYSYWTFSDIFEEQSQKPGIFHGGFGLQTVEGIEKPVFRLFEFFHNLGNQRIKVEDNNNSTAEILAVQKGKDLQIVAYNHNVPSGKIKTEQLTIDLDHKFNGNYEIKRIDENHANPKKLWQEMGEPTYVDKEQLAKLRSASQLVSEQLAIKSGKINLELLPQSCALITILNYFLQDYISVVNKYLNIT